MNHTTLQRRFAARIRDPQQALPPGIATERMAIYEELFFNNLDGFISSGFPVLRRLFDEPRWHRLVRAFMREHRCRTPYFSQLGEEFIGWLQDGYRAEEGDPPFLLELAHYEWVELALSLAEAPVEIAAAGLVVVATGLAAGLSLAGPSPGAEPSAGGAAGRADLPAGLARSGGAGALPAPVAIRLSPRAAPERGGEASVTLLPLLRELAGSCGLSADAEYFENAFALLEDWHAQGILMGEGALE